MQALSSMPVSIGFQFYSHFLIDLRYCCVLLHCPVKEFTTAVCQMLSLPHLL